ncbi:hypothetical protein [Stutzerimonas kirkiae]|uniref:Uncharacterized protein n=1 Tax=Stutzerimonas kirkiae TaxID=2211392 RepID=A0A4Q9RE03_9GAMM|nr:hypothetical protein [Stutzerimonas kirkiae]TBU99918.1 hypothetical protein DNJ96_01070 [Stutzerimonas kirkiae]TBV05624.1 hypothetical protein DNJ95_01740 [Stutzerimonas kirkiae]TBV10635.1 hypothetical protein DNK08_06320 [Stutzerimonas kirkiae]TBV17490.1 hypothetical protein DNK01_01145 [Stutzerimonas kirkiae]
MRIFTCTLLASLLASPLALACTVDEANEKAAHLAERISQLTQSDPQRASEINEEMHKMDLERSGEQLGDECQAYDIRLKHLENAERRADIPSVGE